MTDETKPKRARRPKPPSPPPPTTIPYAERWAAFTDDQQAKVAGGRADEISDFIDRLPNLSAAARADIVAADYARLDELTGRIEGVRAHLNRLLTDRAVVFAELVLCDESLSAVGRRANGTPMVVSFALNISKKAR